MPSAFVADVPSESGGTRSIQITAVGGQNTGGHLFTKLPTGHDQLHLRYYIKYAAGSFHHTGGYMGGYNPPTNWPQGGAGIQPTWE